jgi:hypothetical protein
MLDITPATISLVVTIIGIIVSGVWFVARQAEQLREKLEEGDGDSRRDAAAALEAASRARDAQMERMAADLRETQRNSASREELRITEGRLTETLRRIESKMDSMSEKVAATGVLGEHVRHLAGRIESIDNRIPRTAERRVAQP